MKRSAGILLYRKKEGRYEILLSHCGGPYWKEKERGAWSLNKGLQEGKEKLIETAQREVFEETNLKIQEEITYFVSRKISRKKLVIMFKAYFDGDIRNFRSNTFTLEWPKGSGEVKEFPEMDRIKWFSVEEALEYINKSQRYFIERFQKEIAS